MELKSCCNDAMMGGLLGSNRTFMELKYLRKNVINIKQSNVLIVPLWN